MFVLFVLAVLTLLSLAVMVLEETVEDVHKLPAEDAS